MSILHARSAVRALALVLLCGAPLAASAQSVYVAPSTTGLALGYAHRYDGGLFGSRAEIAWLPSVGRSFVEDGIDYSGDVKSVRGTALVDWHPMRGGFRVTAGLSAVNASGEFGGAPASGSTITIGGATVPVGPLDRYDVRAELPRAMPYVGLGWGNGAARGWGLHVDVGVLIGSPTVTGTLSPSLRAKIALAGLDPDAELERELQTVRDTAAKIDAIPVVAIGASYRW
jgi:hypothetical protein